MQQHLNKQRGAHVDREHIPHVCQTDREVVGC